MSNQAILRQRIGKNEKYSQICVHGDRLAKTDTSVTEFTDWAAPVPL